MTKYSVGYVVAEPRFDNVVEVLWDAGHDSDFGRTREALEPLAATLAGTGWSVQRAEGAIPFDDGDIRWPVLIVTAPPESSPMTTIQPPTAPPPGTDPGAPKGEPR